MLEYYQKHKDLSFKCYQKALDEGKEKEADKYIQEYLDYTELYEIYNKK